jgi:hypothetical protein
MKVANMEIPGLSFGIFALIAGLAAYYLGTRTGKAKDSPGNILNAAIDSNQLTYELNQYEIYSQRIYDITSGVFNHNTELYGVFAKMRNDSDLLQLIKTFGSRGSFWTGGKCTLVEWVTSDLNDVDLKELNNILAQNNIKYQF